MIRLTGMGGIFFRANEQARYSRPLSMAVGQKERVGPNE